MPQKKKNKKNRLSRTVQAVYGRKSVTKDAAYESGLADFFSKKYSHEERHALLARYQSGKEPLDELMRRVIWKSLVKKMGQGVQVGEDVLCKHPETFVIGDGVFIGAQTYFQGRFDGTFRIGNHVWIGPQSYFDARNLIIEDYVGWGPGAKVLGSQHTGLPANVPIIKTNLRIKPVRVKEGADIGMNATILPGVTIGKGSIVGAGAVVTKDVPDYAVVAGVPAAFLSWRKGFESKDARGKRTRKR